MRRDALESRADRGMREYVTSGAPLVTTRAKRHAPRYGLTPHRAGELDGSRHTSGAKASRSTHRLKAAISGVGLG